MKAEYKVLRDNIRNNLWNGIAWSIGFNFVTPFIGVLAARLGATNRDYALLSSIPALLTILLLMPASMIISRFHRQKRIIAGLILICRFFYFLLFFVPHLNVSAMTALILLVGLYNATNAVIAVAWQSMMGEIIPASYRNRVLAQRNMWTGFIGMVIAFIAGWGIDRIPYPYGYQAAFTIGFASALVETWFFLKLRIPREDDASAADKPEAEKSSPVPHEAGGDKGGKPLQSWSERYQLNHGRTYYLFCASAILFTFAWQAAWPIYTKVRADTLLATNTEISIDTIAGAIGSLIGYRLWARVADSKGTGWTVFVTAFLLALTPYGWVYIPNMHWVYLYDFIGGIATAGFQQSVFNRLLEMVTDHGRQRAIAIYTTLSQISAIFAPIAGMHLYSSLSYEATMIWIGCIRIFGALCFLVILTPLIIRWARTSTKPNAGEKQSL